MKKLLFGLLVLASAQAFAVTQYFNPSCSVNGDGTIPTCVGGGTSGGSGTPGTAGAFNASGSVTLARGNIAYVCGRVTSAWNPGGVGTGDGATNQIIDCACPGNGGVFNVSGGIAMQIGGGSRANITVRNCEAYGGTSFVQLGGHTSGSVNFLLENNYVHHMTDSAFRLNPAADNTVSNFEIRYNTTENIGVAGADNGTPFGVAGDGYGDNPLGAAVSIIPAAQGVGAASGLVTTGSIHDNIFRGSIEVGRYGFSCYPPDNLSTGGRGRLITLYRNTYVAPFRHSAINVTNDCDTGTIYSETFDYSKGQFGGAVIHLGGQASGGATTDGWTIRDLPDVCCAVPRQDNVADANGLYADEGSTTSTWQRIWTHGNRQSGIYLNDANGHTLESIVSSDNGDNALNIHGISGGNDFRHLTLIQDNSSTPSGFASQGRDVVQVDATNLGTNTLRNSILVGLNGVPKCLDVDDILFTENNNNYYGCTALSEGITRSGTSKYVQPAFFGGVEPTTLAGFALPLNSPLCFAGAQLAATATLDVLGMAMPNPPPIGAMRCRAGTVAPGRNP